MSLSIRVYSVYLNPPDHPGKWVVRHHRPGVSPKSTPIAIADSYLEVLGRLPRGLSRKSPGPADNSCLYETWR